MKIKFIIGTMGAGKSAEVLKYAEENITLLYKVSHTEKGKSKIESRNGHSKECNVINVKQNAFEVLADLTQAILYSSATSIVIDEAQFLNSEHITAIEKASQIFGLDIIFCGLLSDFRGEIFEGSEFILNITNELIPIVSYCEEDGCIERAIFNARIADGKLQTTGKLVVEAKDMYKAVCARHFKILRKLN